MKEDFPQYSIIIRNCTS